MKRLLIGGKMNITPYEKSQLALAQLKGAIYELVLQNNEMGLRNVEIGRALGIYSGHIGHEGHISRTLLEMMKVEGIVYQSDDKKWYAVLVKE